MFSHWGWVTHIYVSKLTIIDSDNGLSPGRRQAIIWINAGIFNWTLRNKHQWNVDRNSNIFIWKNAFESVVCQTGGHLARPQYVNGGFCAANYLLRYCYVEKVLIAFYHAVLVQSLLLQFPLKITASAQLFSNMASRLTDSWAMSESCRQLKEILTHKQLEMHGCMLSPVATDALVLYSSHSADKVPSGL